MPATLSNLIVQKTVGVAPKFKPVTVMATPAVAYEVGLEFEITGAPYDRVLLAGVEPVGVNTTATLLPMPGGKVHTTCECAQV